MSSENYIGEWTKAWTEQNQLFCKYEFEAGSTNDIAKTFPFSADEPALFITETQTKGRGRGSNLWVNPKPGASLLSTWSFHLQKAPQPIATPRLGLAVYRALHSTLGIKSLSLKAPNDIYVDGKKAGGLLIEVVSQGSSYRLNIGFGLNVFAKPEIANSNEINSFTSEPLHQENWTLFLNTLYDEFQRALDECVQPYLTSTAQEELLVALNHNPNLKEKFVVVELNGNLRTKNTTISWSSL